MVEHLGTQKVFRFSEQELHLLERLAKEHGSQKAAVMAGLRALEARGGISDDELIAVITRRIRENRRTSKK